MRSASLGGVGALEFEDLDAERCRSSTKLVDGELRLALVGDVETPIREKLHRLLFELDRETRRLGVKTVLVDFRALEFMNSSCFKAFVTWIDHAKHHEEYRIRFVSSETQTWHRRSLSALRAFAPDLVTIEVR
jgi:hypothetical protein